MHFLFNMEFFQIENNLERMKIKIKAKFQTSKKICNELTK